jgi:hypothetical protein
MEDKSHTIEVKNFDVIFEKLAEAKADQGLEFNEDINLSLETSKTIMMFREFQESFIQQSYSVLTRG